MNSCTDSSGCELLVKLSTSSFSQTSSCCCDSSWLKLLLQQLKQQSCRSITRITAYDNFFSESKRYYFLVISESYHSKSTMFLGVKCKT